MIFSCLYQKASPRRSFHPRRGFLEAKINRPWQRGYAQEGLTFEITHVCILLRVYFRVWEDDRKVIDVKLHPELYLVDASYLSTDYWYVTENFHYA